MMMVYQRYVLTLLYCISVFVVVVNFGFKYIYGDKNKQTTKQIIKIKTSNSDISKHKNMNNVDFYTMSILLLPLLCAVMIFLAQGLAVATSGRVYYKGMKDIMRHLNALATLYNIVLRMKT